MMRIRFAVRVTVLLLFLLTLLSTTACGTGGEAPVGMILSAMLSCEEDCPAGAIYTMGAEEGEIGHFSASLCIALYGDGEIPSEWTQIEDFAIFLTATEHPCELAVFRCRTGDGATEVAELCARRLAVLRNYWRGGDYEHYTSGGRIMILGEIVIMAVSSDADEALEAGREVIS